MENTRSAALVIIGNEILSGRTQDLNAAYLARRLGERGIVMQEIRVVADEADAIIEAVTALRSRNDYVFTTGGIGPTHDDITTATIAELFDRRVVLNPEAEQALRAHMLGRVEMNEARLRMAHIPEGATLIDNPVSGAPGFVLDNVYVLPGVPKIMQGMFELLLDKLEGGAPVLSLGVTGAVREGEIADQLAEIQSRYPNLALGSYPFAESGRIGTRIVVRGTNRPDCRAATDEVFDMMTAIDPAATRDGEHT